MTGKIPEKIGRLIAQKTYTIDVVGLSGAQVMMFDDMVLKIEAFSEENDRTVRMMRWLKGRLPVPEVLCFEADEASQYLLMNRVRGRMSCDAYYLERPELLLSLLAKAIRAWQSLDISGCPRRRSVDDELAEARMRVQKGLVDLEHVDPGTFGADGFADPEALLLWLGEHKPKEEPVLSHGDFCLPNIFLDGDGISGFLDLGRVAVADRWKDIAICYRSLKHNFDGTYGGRAYPDFDPNRLFDALDITPDWDKIRWYTLLDELF